MCVGDETKHCKVQKGRNVCVRKQREEERMRGECLQGMHVGEGRRARDGQGSKALKGEVVQGMRVRTPREDEV